MIDDDDDERFTRVALEPQSASGSQAVVVRQYRQALMAPSAACRVQCKHDQFNGNGFNRRTFARARLYLHD